MVLNAVDPNAPPSKLAWAAEAPRAILGLTKLLAAWPEIRNVPQGDGRPLLLLPGLLNADRSLLGLKLYLDHIGYATHGWELGRNLGPRSIGGPEGPLLRQRIEAIRDAAGAPVTLIGVSLGGIMARIMAHRHPELVREVITISSPFCGSGRATNVWLAYELVSGERVDSPAAQAFLEEAARPLPVPSTAIWSRSDGLVNGLNCYDPGGRSIEVNSGHLWVQMRAEVLCAVANAIGERQ